MNITAPTSRHCELIYKVMFATQLEHPSITHRYNDGVVECGFYGIWFICVLNFMYRRRATIQRFSCTIHIAGMIIATMSYCGNQ